MPMVGFKGSINFFIEAEKNKYLRQQKCLFIIGRRKCSRSGTFYEACDNPMGTTQLKFQRRKISQATKREKANLGEGMHHLMRRLFPICRSITGHGVRETLKIIQEYIPLKVHEISTGTKVFDWAIPREWNIKDAYIKNSKGERIIDFKKSNLHVLNYSIPIHKKMTDRKSVL